MSRGQNSFISLEEEEKVEVQSNGHQGRKQPLPQLILVRRVTAEELATREKVLKILARMAERG